MLAESDKSTSWAKKCRKNHFLLQIDRKNSNFENSFDGSMEHRMDLVRAKYELRWGPDALSNPNLVIFRFCVEKPLDFYHFPCNLITFRRFDREVRG